MQMSSASDQEPGRNGRAQPRAGIRIRGFSSSSGHKFLRSLERAARTREAA